MVLASAMTITFMVTVKLIQDAYEEDTGKKASAESIGLMLVKECIRCTKIKPPSSQRKKAK